MRLGIFGGTFDPPHIGHLILAQEAYAQLNLDQVIWMLTPDPPHKHGQIIRPWSVRMEMVAAAIADNPHFVLSTIEAERSGPHYTVDTVKIWLEQHPSDELYYMIGGDSLRDLPNWYHPDELIELITGLVVMRRPGVYFDLEQLGGLLPALKQKIHFIGAPALEISSSDIRERIKQGRPYRYYLTEAVYRMILSKGFYEN